jgi:hypothetical protein
MNSTLSASSQEYILPSKEVHYKNLYTAIESIKYKLQILLPDTTCTIEEFGICILYEILVNMTTAFVYMNEHYPTTKSFAIRLLKEAIETLKIAIKYESPMICYNNVVKAYFCVGASLADFHLS